MKENITQKLADYFDIPKELLPFLPELFSDLWELGSSTDIIIDWIRLTNLQSNARVLDLGCGKGPVSIKLAKEFGFNVLGIDFFEPFIIEAKKKAKDYGVSELCRFECDDMRNRLKSEVDYDVVIYSAIGNVLGTVERWIKKLRKTIRGGGFMLIDDGFKKTDKGINLSGYEHYVPYEETIRQLTVCGDKIIQEKIFSRDEMKMMNDRNTELISKRVKDLAGKYPKLADKFYELLEMEKQECQILENDIPGAMWLIQKS
ncbi:methyltransferase domain-containing protein [candidate division KSB1 bacterium]|nr:methyltransferase domain-containing protein [candidate division KSB1 bacterium]